jgi:hypothetical protein
MAELFQARKCILLVCEGGGGGELLKHWQGFPGFYCVSTN